MTAVPGEARISGVPLVAPRVGSGYRLPSGIIERWRGPPWIIACMKLPETIELNLALTQSLNDENGLRPWHEATGQEEHSDPTATDLEGSHRSSSELPWDESPK